MKEIDEATGAEEQQTGDFKLKLTKQMSSSMPQKAIRELMEHLTSLLNKTDNTDIEKER